MIVHSAFQSLLLIFLKGVRSHSEYRYGSQLLIFKLSYGSCSAVPVHYRHLHVHKHKLIIPGFRVLQHIYCYLTVIRHLNTEAFLA